MEKAVQDARNNMLEWWFIFSKTGEINDAMMLVDSIRSYDLLLSNDLDMEM